MSVKRSIRRALEGPLPNAAIAAGVLLPVGHAHAGQPAIAWGNLSFRSDAKDLAAYLRPSVHFANYRVRTIGPTPRIEASGILKVAVFTRGGDGEDRNDTIAGIVEAAYPYGSVLEFGGISVKVEQTDPSDGVLVGPWWSSTVNVNWNVWRAT